MTAVVKLLPGILWFTLILYLLTLPGSQIPKIGWMDNLQVDKLVHIFLFFTLVACWSCGIVSIRPQSGIRQTVFVVAIAALAYGIAMEFVQKYWVINRSFDGWDIVADGIGSFLPLLFIKQLKKLIFYRRQAMI